MTNSVKCFQFGLQLVIKCGKQLRIKNITDMIKICNHRKHKTNKLAMLERMLCFRINCKTNFAGTKIIHLKVEDVTERGKQEGWTSLFRAKSISLPIRSSTAPTARAADIR